MDTGSASPLQAALTDHHCDTVSDCLKIHTVTCVDSARNQSLGLSCFSLPSVLPLSGVDGRLRSSPPHEHYQSSWAF